MCTVELGIVFVNVYIQAMYYSWGGVQTQVSRLIMVHLPRRTMEWTWRYTSAAAAKQAVGFLTIGEYLRQHQITVAQYISTRLLLDLCEGSERDPGVRVGMWWCEQEGIYLSVAVAEY